MFDLISIYNKYIIFFQQCFSFFFVLPPPVPWCAPPNIYYVLTIVATCTHQHTILILQARRQL